MGTILVTGGAGFIGSHLTNYLSKKNKVIVVDDLSMGNLNNLNLDENVKFIEGSITNKELMNKLFSEYKFEYIFHLAAIASVADSVNRPLETHNVNMEATLQLLDLAKDQKENIKRFVFSSSAAVYGDHPSIPKTEESVIRPLTPYAIDKYSSEQYAIIYNKLYNLRTTAVRFFNVYGINQNPSSPYSGVISIINNYFYQLYKNNNEDLEFKLFGDGEQTRDFVYVNDVVNALCLVATKDEGIGNVYNIGTGKGTSINEILRTYSDITGISPKIITKPARVGDIRDSIASIDKLESIGFKRSFDITDGIRLYWEDSINR